MKGYCELAGNSAMKHRRFSVRFAAMFLLILFFAPRIQAQIFPRLTSLDNRDPAFLQISDDIQAFYRWQAGADFAPSLSIYSYVVQPGDSLFSLSARLNIPQSSIATINRLNNPQLPEAGSEILIPNIPGVFVPDTPQGDFEMLLSSRIQEDESFELSEAFRLPDGQGGSASWRFIVAGDFTSLERRAFLQVLFRDPLPSGIISSVYGLRTSPFTGQSQFHFGIDLAAPQGTVVRAALEGEVIDSGTDDIYGLYLSIEHPGGYRTVYAHLQEVFVSVGDSVIAGGRIASAGSTGLSTGNHLHFEVFYLGRNRDPQLYIRREN